MSSDLPSNIEHEIKQFAQQRRMKRSVCAQRTPAHQKRKWAMVLLLSVASVNLAMRAQSQPSTDSYAQRVGIVIEDEKGVCLMIANSDLRIGHRVEIAIPTQPRSRAEAVVVRRNPRCATKGNDSPPQVSYDLRLTKGSLPENEPVIGLTGAAVRLTATPGGLLAYLQPNQSPVSFHSCVSQEGVHLTLWQGKPLTGIRAWHGYYYLNYDVETTTCAAVETKEP